MLEQKAVLVLVLTAQKMQPLHQQLRSSGRCLLLPRSTVAASVARPKF